MRHVTPDLGGSDVYAVNPVVNFVNVPIYYAPWSKIESDTTGQKYDNTTAASLIGDAVESEFWVIMRCHENEHWFPRDKRFIDSKATKVRVPKESKCCSRHGAPRNLKEAPQALNMWPRCGQTFKVPTYYYTTTAACPHRLLSTI